MTFQNIPERNLLKYLDDDDEKLTNRFEIKDIALLFTTSSKFD
jgi:hypothetical protein